LFKTIFIGLVPGVPQVGNYKVVSAITSDLITSSNSGLIGEIQNTSAQFPEKDGTYQYFPIWYTPKECCWSLQLLMSVRPLIGLLIQ
jgi:hypothetical protein